MYNFAVLKPEKSGDTNLQLWAASGGPGAAELTKSEKLKIWKPRERETMK